MLCMSILAADTRANSLVNRSSQLHTSHNGQFVFFCPALVNIFVAEELWKTTRCLTLSVQTPIDSTDQVAWSLFWVLHQLKCLSKLSGHSMAFCLFMQTSHISLYIAAMGLAC